MWQRQSILLCTINNTGRRSGGGRVPCLGSRNSGNSVNVPSLEEIAMGELCGDDSSMHPSKASSTTSDPRSSATTAGTALSATASTTLPDSYFVLLELSRIGVRERNREPRDGAAIHPKNMESSASLHSRAIPVGRLTTSLASRPPAARTSSDNESGGRTASLQMSHTSKTSKKFTDGSGGAGGTRVKARSQTKSNNDKSGEGKL